MDKNELVLFLKEMGPLCEFLEKSVCTYLIKREDGKRYLKYCRIDVLSKRDALNFYPQIKRIENRFLEIGQIEVSRVPEIMFGSEDVSFRTLIPLNDLLLSVCDPGEINSVQSYFSSHPASAQNVRSPYIGIDFKNEINSFSWLHEKIKNELLCSNTSFGSMAELLDYFRIPRDNEHRRTIQCEIYIHPHSWIDTSKIEIKNGKLKISAICPLGIEKREVKIGLNFIDGETKTIKRIFNDGSDGKWVTSDFDSRGEFEFNVGDSAAAQCVLSYKGQWFFIASAVDPKKSLNMGNALYTIYDEKHEILKKLLYENTDDRARFESGVSLLLALLGFRTTHIGVIKKLQKGPDIIAYVPNSEDIIAIECTTQLNDVSVKIDKLLQRSNEIERILKEIFSRSRVLRVLVTNVSKVSFKDHEEEFRAKRVLLLSKEDLEAGENRLSHMPNPQALFEEGFGLLTRINFG